MLVSYFKCPSSNHRLAYRYTPPSSHLLTVVYLYGFRSDMNGDKVSFLETQCRHNGLGFLTFDYSGHGASSGTFEEGTISQWLADSLTVIDHFVKSPIIIVGSSMGGWLAHLVALERPRLIVGLLGIASAPDFTHELMWKKFSPTQQAEVLNQGWTIVPTEYNTQGWTITKNLIEDGRKHLILDKPIDLGIPIRLIHGMQDISVPMSYSQRLVDLTRSQDITLTLIKSGNHRLSRNEDKRVLRQLLMDLIVGYRLTNKQ